jgi:hypothetical protein
MGKISAYESAYGRIFKDRALYRKHCAWLELRRIVEATVCAAGNCKCDTPYDIKNATRELLSDRDELIKLLRVAEEVEP